MIYTSNYTISGTHPNSIAISRSVPDWYQGKREMTLAPSWDLILSYKNKSITEKEYTDRYIKQLFSRGYTSGQLILDRLPKGTILLCYEKPSEFCHRHILAEFINMTTNIEIVEWSDHVTSQINKITKLFNNADN